MMFLLFLYYKIKLYNINLERKIIISIKIIYKTLSINENIDSNDITHLTPFSWKTSRNMTSRTINIQTN